MKICINIGAINATKNTPAHQVLSSYTSKDGVRAEEKYTDIPARNTVFTMEASSYSFECEVGELADVYKAVAPIMSEVLTTLKSIKKMES